MIAILAAGLLAGALHALSGPDHLAAIAPFAARAGRRAVGPGVRWGLGHAAGLGLLAILVLSLRGLLPLERLSGASERLVGVVLIGIGLWALRSVITYRVHAHEHEHDGIQHTHVHVHRRDGAVHGPHRHTHAAFPVGVLHGFAGGSHLLAVLPALALPGTGATLFWLGGYGLGSIGAMALFALAIGRVASRLGDGTTYRGLMTACSTAAIGVGVFWLVR